MVEYVTKSNYINYITLKFNMLEAEEFDHKCCIGTIWSQFDFWKKVTC